MEINKKRSKSDRLIQKYIQIRDLNNGLLNSMDFKPNFEIPGLFSKESLEESFKLFKQ